MTSSVRRMSYRGEEHGPRLLRWGWLTDPSFGIDESGLGGGWPSAWQGDFSTLAQGDRVDLFLGAEVKGSNVVRKALIA